MTDFISDMTLRWACRAGDYILWARFQGIASGTGKEYAIEDVWQLGDGDFVTLTNRAVDLPVWFELHSLEASGRNVRWMQRKLASGYKPEEIMEGPNLWRVFAGDRVVWVGPRRAGTEEADGILDLLEFRENALVYAEPISASLFGGLTAGGPPPQAAKLCNAGWEAVEQAGLPRTVAADGQWCIG